MDKKLGNRVVVNNGSKTHLSGNYRKKLFIAWMILLTAWITMTVIPLVTNDTIGRLFADYDDRKVYFERGKWLLEGRPALSEYPQIPTWLFGLNHLTSISFKSDLQFDVYAAAFSLEMLIVLFLVFRALQELLPPASSKYAFLLLLPPTLYFTSNRFDILPAYFCLIAYSSATKKRWGVSSIMLAIATFTKWYPILLFPGFLIYANTIEAKFQWKMILLFGMTSSLILLLSYLQGGMEAILTPYRVHLMRSMEFVALPILINNLIHNVLNVNIHVTYFFLFFFILQISGPFLILFIKMDSLESVTHYCIVTIGLFILFSRIWSPQWFLWLMPFLLISTKDLTIAGLITAYNFSSYVSFPIIFDYYRGSSLQLQVSSLVTYGIILVFILRSIRNLNFSITSLTQKGSTEQI